MKKFFSLIFGLFWTFSMNAQGDLTIGLVMPEGEFDEIQPDAYMYLRSKLEEKLATAGVSALGGNFVMYPVVNIVEENLIEGGIKNYFKVKIELTLNVTNLTSRTLFSSESWTLVGVSERFRGPAVKNAFTQLNGNDSRFNAFIINTKSKIYKYYEENKSVILAQASSFASTGDFDAALALLSSYPSQVNGYDEALSLLHKIYIQYINVNSAHILNKARAAYAVKDYEQAVNLAAQIGPESSHSKEAKTIIEQVRTIVSKEQDEDNKRAWKALELAADLQKTRINAVASVARAYYGRTVSYNFVKLY